MTKRPLDVIGALSSLPMFQTLNAQELARLAVGTRVLRAGRGQVLFSKGEPAENCHIVLFGKVKLALSAGTTQEKVLEIVGPGESFGEALLFLGKPYPVTAECLVESLVLQVPGSNLFAAVDANPRFARQVLAGLSARLHRLINDVEAFSTRNAAQRLVGYLLNLCGGGSSAELPTSKHVIASLLNLTPETLSRILHALTVDGLIEVDGRRIVIRDAGRLREYA